MNFKFLVVIWCCSLTTIIKGQQDRPIAPYMGWSSWSMQASTRPGLGLSWLREDNIIRQIDAMANNLKEFGYTYINLDSGWNADYDWNAGFDEYGRPTWNLER